MTRFSIRPMRAADYDDVLELWRESEGIGLSGSDSRASIETFLHRNPDLSLVALDEAGAVIGAVLCGWDGLRGYLRHLAVSPRHRTRGIGRALVDRCLDEMRRLGVHKVSVFVFADNEEGQQFWKRTGWALRPDLRVMQVVLTDPSTLSAPLP